MQKVSLSRPIKFEPWNLKPSFPVQSFLYWREAASQKSDFPIHYHNCLEIGYCHEGHGIFSIENESFKFDKGDAVIISSGKSHYGCSSSDVESVWSWIFLDPVKLLEARVDNTEILDLHQLTGHLHSKVFKRENNSEIILLIERMISELHYKQKYYTEAFKAITRLLLVEVQRREILLENPTFHIKGTFDKIESFTPAIKHIQKNFWKKISIAELSSLCCLSLPYFSRSFKKCIGKSAYQYILDYRLAMASVALKKSNKRIDIIAIENGFPTLSCFIRAFEKKFGISPGKWKRKNLGINGMSDV